MMLSAAAVPKAIACASRPAGPQQRPSGRPLSGRCRMLVVRASDKPEEPSGDIDMGPKGASRSFQDMKNAQESYAELPRQKQAGSGASPASEKDAPDQAPESGTVREEAPYPYTREPSGSNSSEEEHPKMTT